MLTEIALFPLSSVLMPRARMPLQIFERRYLDLVARCMRENAGFGVLWLKQGSEVSGGSLDVPNISDVGTYASIVDWDQLPNGLLGITIEGRQRFAVESVWREADGLIKAEVSLDVPPESTPLPDHYSGLAEVLESLLWHPQVKRLGLSLDLKDAWTVAYLLGQLLPLDESIKHELLNLDSLEQLLEELDTLLRELSGEAPG
ncbi:MAG: LON peptidase substrate-binding domain-containing protein [Proteobacteria bacterium]|nr:LON peptidase substrate-binding domain-containing protein [Pseudomonadota bacterium]